MTRWFAAVAIVVLGVAAAPPTARAPTVDLPGWEWFAQQALLEAAVAAAGGFTPFDPVATLPTRQPASATPEPAAALLTALGLGGLALGRRRRARQ